MLEQLYSETGLINGPVEFRSGINLILGQDPPRRGEGGMNGIGKSSLVRLVDYALLSDGAAKRFSLEKYSFMAGENHSITLRFRLRGQVRFIRRTFGKERGVVSFGSSPLSMVDYEVAELKQILLGQMFPIESEKVWYSGDRFRTLMNFYIKDDLDQTMRSDPMAFYSFHASRQEVIAYNFFLLNLPNTAQLRYSEVLKEYKKINTSVSVIRDRIKAETGKDVQEFESERLSMQEKINLLEAGLKRFTFADIYKEIESELAEVTSKINATVKELYAVSKKIRQIRSLTVKDADLSPVDYAGLYEELTQTFGDLVKKTLDEIIVFRRSIVENRLRHNLERERSLVEEQNKIEGQLAILEEKRSSLLRQLDEKGEFEVLSNTYEQLVSEKAALAENEQRVNDLNKSYNALQSLDVEISALKVEMSDDLQLAGTQLSLLRTLFREIIDNAIFKNEEKEGSGYFDISRVSSGRRDRLPFDISIEVPRSDAVGRARLKLVAYDLMVFLQSVRSGRQLPRFLVHDGVFHGISRRSVIDTLNYVYRQTLAYPGFQYLVTFNEDEIYVSEERVESDGEFEFDLKEATVARYWDGPGGLIFGRVFR